MCKSDNCSCRILVVVDITVYNTACLTCVSVVNHGNRNPLASVEPIGYTGNITDIITHELKSSVLCKAQHIFQFVRRCSILGTSDTYKCKSLTFSCVLVRCKSYGIVKYCCLVLKIICNNDIVPGLALDHNTVICLVNVCCTRIVRNNLICVFDHVERVVISYLVVLKECRIKLKRVCITVHNARSTATVYGIIAITLVICGQECIGVKLEDITRICSKNSLLVSVNIELGKSDIVSKGKGDLVVSCIAYCRSVCNTNHTYHLTVGKNRASGFIVCVKK